MDIKYSSQFSRSLHSSDFVSWHNCENILGILRCIYMFFEMYIYAILVALITEYIGGVGTPRPVVLPLPKIFQLYEGVVL